MNKIDQAQEELKNLEIDGWLIPCNEQSDIHSPFLLGVKVYARHYIFIDGKGTHKILSSRMEAPMIQKSLKRMKIKAEVKYYNSIPEIHTFLKETLNKKKVAVNYGENILNSGGSGYADYIKHGEFESLVQLCPEAEFISSADLIWNIRTIKTQEELQDLRETAKAQIEILEDLPNWVKIGMTEKQIQAKLEYKYRKLGESAFDAIVGSGANSADPHHNSSMKKIKKGCLLVDSGLKRDKMCSDITWTYWIGSEPPEDFNSAYNALLEAKNEADKYYIEGELPKTPALKCREKIQELGYDDKELFIHGLGHSLGYETHDIGIPISWRATAEIPLKKNMVYSNEPGLYWQGKWGIRLEDDLIIGSEKPEIVTYCPKDPIVI